MGNQALLSKALVAFFASRQCPGTAIRSATGWTIAQTKARQAVISGFHAPLEQSVLQLLLYARSPAVAVLARPLKEARLPADWEPATRAGHIPLLFLQTPLQLTLTRIAFGLAASLMLPAIVRLLRSHAPQGMDARAISYAASFQFIAMGIAPFTAGLIGPLLGLRAYFALTVMLTFVAFGLWLRSERRGV